jgi:Tol biopolymer transport system component
VRIPVGMFVSLLTCASWGALAGEAPKAPVAEDEKKKLLEAETPEQKKLREEMKASGGRIFYCVQGQIWEVGLDGSAEKQVTRFTPAEMPSAWPNVALDYPHVSPDGKKLIAEQWGSKVQADKFLLKPDAKGIPLDQRDNSREYRVTYLMNIDGSDPKPLGHCWCPHWSPDGKHLCYSINSKNRRGGRPVAVLDLEKMEEHVLDSNARGPFPVFSADGKWILVPLKAFPVNADCTGLDPARKIGRYTQGPDGCNTEGSYDGKWATWTIDTYGEAGGWIMYSSFSPEKPEKAVKANLGWQDKSVNYDSAFSPDGKFMVYMHGEVVAGKTSYSGVPSELYVTRFPPDGVNARITWHNAAARHPHWVTASGAWK